MSKIVLISGSPSNSSRLNGMTNYIREQLSKAGHDTALIQVVDLPPEDLVFSRFSSPSIVAANELVAQADAVIIASPVYKASYTGVLKSYIDLLPQKGLEGKVVLPVFIAGSSSHLLAIDYSLKPVLASMGARLYAKNVYATDNMIEREQDENGNYLFTINPEIITRIDESIKDLIALL